ncbi:hypothetical protein NDU88_000730 [Pleurodeles waltl]|uniref:Uncharacterized protein n=1 Tax=Pleurodeles waltl TaxID=8319 RepID=A0AAV7KMT7_PLEWA|nr:hypothetical protein NDU88_000730 [Pleurodeles waltl]
MRVVVRGRTALPPDVVTVSQRRQPIGQSPRVCYSKRRITTLVFRSQNRIMPFMQNNQHRIKPLAQDIKCHRLPVVHDNRHHTKTLIQLRFCRMMPLVHKIGTNR